jgi:nitrilase
MGMKEDDKCKVSEEFASGLIQTSISSLARQHGIWIVAGTIPIKTADDKKVAAASLVYDAQGVCVARYDKIHLFDVTVSSEEKYHESTTILPGHEPAICQTPLGVLGLSVCYDIRFPELYQHLLKMGAEMIVIPAAFTVKTGEAHWDVLIRARAIENGCYVIAAAQGGLHTNGRRTYGHSMIVDPWGQIIAQIANDEPGVICAEIDLDFLQLIRNKLPMQAHKRLS